MALDTIPPTARIIFMRTDRLGETILNLPAVAALKGALPQATITFLGQADIIELLADVPDIDHVLRYEEGRLRLWIWRAIRLAGRLRREHFDVAVISNPKKELHLAAWLAGIRWRIGYNHKWSGLLTQQVPDCKALGERHEVEYNLNLVRALGLKVSLPEWRFPDFIREEAEVKELLKRQGIRASEPFVAIHPWASNPGKRWPTDRYRSLIRHIVERLQVQVVVIGGAEERVGIGGILPSDLAIGNLTGCLTLPQLAALLQKAALLISNDSGPVHLAAAVGTKTVVLFGTNNSANGPRRWGPWGMQGAVIWKASMDMISVDEVMAALVTAYHG